jgi:hypothetical protein
MLALKNWAAGSTHKASDDWIIAPSCETKLHLAGIVAEDSCCFHWREKFKHMFHDSYRVQNMEDRVVLMVCR